MIDEYTLYVDNFRGFRDTYVPITKVNFLVGENSSGKTSLLSLLRLMSEERLLTESQFLAEDVDLGTFDDIASAHAGDVKHFRIGMIRWNVTENIRTPLAMLVTYEKYEGLPRDVCFSCTYLNKQVALRRVGKECHFKTTTLALSSNTDVRGLVTKWAKEHEDPPGDFKKLDFPLSDNQSLLFPLSLVAQNIPVISAEHHVPLLNPRVFPPVTWIAPIRTKPRRTYDELRRGFSSEGTHTPYLIRKILDTESQAERFRKIIHKVGRDSGLFERIDIKRFGKDVTAPFEVQIILDKKSFNLVNVGYGVSQALPVLVEVLWRKPGTWFAIQQPEVHLHPRAQAALGDLIFMMAATEDKHFLIETHSDFMIDRYRTNMRRVRAKKSNSQVLFFERHQSRNTVMEILGL